jgi:hypothetical protein
MENINEKTENNEDVSGTSNVKPRGQRGGGGKGKGTKRARQDNVQGPNKKK